MDDFVYKELEKGKMYYYRDKSYRIDRSLLTFLSIDNRRGYNFILNWISNKSSSEYVGKPTTYKGKGNFTDYLYPVDSLKEEQQIELIREIFTS